jgi:hypothetical protein
MRTVLLASAATFALLVAQPSFAQTNDGTPPPPVMVQPPAMVPPGGNMGAHPAEQAAPHGQAMNAQHQATKDQVLESGEKSAVPGQ